MSEPNDILREIGVDEKYLDTKTEWDAKHAAPLLAGEAAAESDFRQNDEVLDERPPEVYEMSPGAWMTVEDHAEVDTALLNQRPQIDPLGDAYISHTINPRVQAVLAARTPETRAACSVAAAQVIRHEVEEAFKAVGLA